MLRLLASALGETHVAVGVSCRLLVMMVERMLTL